MANYHYTFDEVSNALPVLAAEIIHGGDEVGSRLGERVKELTNVAIRLDKPVNREQLHPMRRANLAAQIAESMWVLSGRDDIDWLGHYLPRAADFSDDGETWRGAYGPRLRCWGSEGPDGYTEVDQLAEVVKLLKSNPTSRRAVMNIFDPGQDFGDYKDVPCNNWLSFSNRLGKLDLHVAIRSNDLWWGWTGINTFEWSVLLEIVARMVGVAPGALHFSTTSLHLYDRHWGVAERVSKNRTRLGDSLIDSPRFKLTADLNNVQGLDRAIASWFAAELRIREEGRRGEFNQHTYRHALDFPEPMMGSWLLVLGYHWSGDDRWLESLRGTRLAAAARLSHRPKIKPVVPEETNIQDVIDVIHDAVPEVGEEVEENQVTEFDKFVANLHAEKNKVYGNSWRKRGEFLSILANVARKVDRLGDAGAGDTAADTAIDLLVYLIKYRLWIVESNHAYAAGHLSDDPDKVAHALAEVGKQAAPTGRINTARVIQSIKDCFEVIQDNAEQGEREKVLQDVIWMTGQAYVLAEELWHEEQAEQERAKWHAGNATRMWNPEAGLTDGE